MPWPERTFRDSAKSSDEWRKEQTTTGEAKPPLTGEVPQTTPAGLDTVDPTIHSEPDSVCPPGCFWLSLDQDYSSSQLSVLQLQSLLFHKAHLEQGKAERTKAGLHVDCQLAVSVGCSNVRLWCCCDLFKKETRSSCSWHRRTLNTFVICIFQHSNILIHHSQHSPCSSYTRDRCTHSCISEQTNAETLTNSYTVIIKDLTRDLFFPSVSNYISQEDGSSAIKWKYQSVNYLLSCLSELLKWNWLLIFFFFQTNVGDVTLSAAPEIKVKLFVVSRHSSFSDGLQLQPALSSSTVTRRLTVPGQCAAYFLVFYSDLRFLHFQLCLINLR